MPEAGTGSGGLEMLLMVCLGGSSAASYAGAGGGAFVLSSSSDVTARVVCEDAGASCLGGSASSPVSNNVVRANDRAAGFSAPPNNDV